ncbi:MAG: hypothetical protein Q9211_006852, partial [Gyalolechia sp. 1 TL-2023]
MDFEIIRVLSVYDDTNEYKIQLPEGARVLRGEYGGRVFVQEDPEFLDGPEADREVELAPFMLVPSARHGWYGLQLLQVIPRDSRHDAGKDPGQDAPADPRTD